MNEEPADPFELFIKDNKFDHKQAAEEQAIEERKETSFDILKSGVKNLTQSIHFFRKSIRLIKEGNHEQHKAKEDTEKSTPDENDEEAVRKSRSKPKLDSNNEVLRSIILNNPQNRQSKARILRGSAVTPTLKDHR
mmetsp:Transcript_12102/g.13787  ORF Transcript_12102/g.13787 Transcript_12102/m.13787 type:complete len:136 (-) Transcript_12102:56-463(-)